MDIPFENVADNPTAPALRCIEISPSDAAELPMVTKAVIVGEAGDITLRAAKSETDVVFRNLPAGFILDVRTRIIRSTGTTAGSLVGLA